MKKIKLWIIVVLPALFFMYSCEEDMFDITNSFTFDYKIEVNDPEETSFAFMEHVDLTEDVSIIEQYSEKIKDIEIEHVKYWVETHNGDSGQTVSIELDVSDINSNNVNSLLIIEGKNLASLVDNPEELDVNYENMKVLEDLIKNQPHEFIFWVDGEASNVPVDFTMVIEFKAKMTTNPLEGDDE